MESVLCYTIFVLFFIFCYTSIRPSAKLEHFHVILYLYINSLKQTLRKGGIPHL